MTHHSTRTILAAALVTAAGLTLAGCNGGTTEPTESTSTASGPSSTQSQDEKDLADAVEVTKAYYDDRVTGDFKAPPKKYVTETFYEKTEENLKVLREQPGEWKGKKNKVISVEPSQRGKTGATTRACIEQNRLQYTGNEPTLVTPDGKKIKPGDRHQILVSLVQEGDTWKVNDTQFEKKGC